jgi:hypothetical protein
MKQYLCNDCGVDVLKIGDWYLAHPKVWEDQLGLSCNDNLCIGCLDKRLGREAICPDDITPILNTVAPDKLSATLLRRFGFKETNGRRK